VATAAVANPTAPPSLSRPAVAHLSVLGALLMLLLAAHHRLAMLSLLTESHGAVTGPGWTDLNVRIPVEWFLLGLCLVLAAALLANVGLRRAGALYIAPVVWVALATLLAAGVPSAVQALVVKPAELSRERDYLAREIDATSHAFGLDAISVRDFPDQQAITPQLFDANPTTVGNLRLWDYAPLQTAYSQLQTFHTYYDFNDVDIDRYQLPDGYRQVMISARELNTANLPTPAQTWVNLHLKYTHGYGAAATPVTKVAAEGKPALVLGDIPPTGDIRLTRPQLYFGETNTGYVVADSLEPELDYQNGDQESYHQWQGSHGVPIASTLRRLAFAVRFGDLNLLISSQIGPNSQILFHRAVAERLSTIAPFLTYDGDPYLVVSGGRMYWIADAYTTSDAYPYGASIDMNGNQVAYIRNSVKVVMDAYEGTVSFYVADPSDPIVRAYSSIFPTLFQPLATMPADLQSHLRYPVDYFQAQMRQWTIYHIKNPQDFFLKGDAWQIAEEVTTQGGPSVPLQPYYVLMRLPDQTQPEFVLIQPFTPLGKKNMVSWVAARSDGANYGKLVNFRFPNGSQVDGPAQVENRIDQTPAISRDFSLFNQAGSKVIRGNLLVIPVGDAIIFIEPIYIAGTSGSGIPELKKVIVADQATVAYEDTLAQALADIAGGGVSSAPAPPSGPPSPSPGAADLASLIQQATTLYDAAQADLRAGDLRKYADDIDKLGQVLQQLRQRGAGGSGPSPSPSPSR
jgi:hypothetical protein